MNDLIKDIAKAKQRLKDKAHESGGVWENFGQNEIRKLKDKYELATLIHSEIAYRLLGQFENWCMNYTTFGGQRK